MPTAIATAPYSFLRPKSNTITYLLNEAFSGTSGTAVTGYTSSYVSGSTGTFNYPGTMTAGTAAYDAVRAISSTMTATSNTELTTTFTFTQQVASFIRIGISCDSTISANAGWATQNGFQLQYTTDATAANASYGIFQLVGDVLTTVVNAAAITLTAGVSYSVHYRKIGSLLQLRTWPTSQAEPGTWDVSFSLTGSQPPAGSILLSVGNGSAATAQACTFGPIKVWNGTGSPATTGNAGTGGKTAGTSPATTYTAAFGTRTATSTPATYSNMSNFTISNQQFNNIGSDVSAIRISGCSNVIIEQIDFDGCCQPITATNCTNLTIRYCRARNITGPHARNGSNRGNFTQWINASGGYIGYNKITGGDTEDVISLYQSNGTAASPIIVEYNQIANDTYGASGTGYTSSSGTGIMLGDGGGTYQVARFNTLHTPGQVGIGVSGGSNIKVQSNIIFGAQTATSNIAMYAADYSSTAGGMNTIEFSNNRANFLNKSGTQNDRFLDTTTVTGFTTTPADTLPDLTVTSASTAVTL